jgi:hypothetical protein
MASFSLVPTPSVPDQHRVAKPGGLQVEQRAEAAEPGHDAGPLGGAWPRA